MIMIALGIALLMGGGASSALTRQLKLDYEQAERVLKGAEQRKEALALIKSMRKISEKSLKESQAALKHGVKAGRDHERPSAEIVSVIEPYERNSADLDRQFLDIRDELRSLLTRAQWDSVFVAPEAQL